MKKHNFAGYDCVIINNDEEWEFWKNEEWISFSGIPKSFPLLASKSDGEWHDYTWKYSATIWEMADLIPAVSALDPEAAQARREEVRLFRDGDRWCALQGDNAQSGRAYFASTPLGAFKMWVGLFGVRGLGLSEDKEPITPEPTEAERFETISQEVGGRIARDIEDKIRQVQRDVHQSNDVKSGKLQVLRNLLDSVRIHAHR